MDRVIDIAHDEFSRRISPVRFLQHREGQEPGSASVVGFRTAVQIVGMGAEFEAVKGGKWSPPADGQSR
jgi:hypothetical protein